MFDVYLQTYDSYRHRTSKGESKEEEEFFKFQIIVLLTFVPASWTTCKDVPTCNTVRRK